MNDLIRKETHDIPGSNAKLELIRFMLPTFYASSLFYDDNSGLSDNDENELNRFLEINLTANGYGTAACDCEDLGFRSQSDLNNLGGDMSFFTFKKI